MKGVLFLTEAGYIIFANTDKPILSHRFQDPPKQFASALKGETGAELVELLEKAGKMGLTSIMVEKKTIQGLPSTALTLEEGDQKTFDDLRANKLELMVESGLVSSKKEARESIRKVALATAEEKIKTQSGALDLQVSQSIQALDEIDKVLNNFASRLREWYGHHFPELASHVSEPTTYARVATIGGRDTLTEKALEEIGLPAKKAESVIASSNRSKGGEIRPEDLLVIRNLAEEVLRVNALRDKVANHVEDTIRKVAPNVSKVAGTTVGARLIAKAGSLSRLATMPASTIQVLGAEKALFRALKTGSRPPKHGYIFQHAEVHSAPRWNRGRVARLIAGKIALAARIDAYRGTEDEGLVKVLERRLKEIKGRQAPAKEPPDDSRRPRHGR